MNVSSGSILIVEDEIIARTRLQTILAKDSSYDISLAENADEALGKLQRRHFDIVLLDIRLPDANDFHLAAYIGSQLDIGLIIISALDDEQSRLQGLRSGADDYLCKPFQTEELLLKVARLVQRTGKNHSLSREGNRHWQFGPWRYYPDAMELIRDGDNKVIKISGQEKRLLSIFIQNPKRVFTRQQLLDALHQNAISEVFDRAIDSAIARLRRRIEANPKRPAILKTVYGEGYLLDAKVKQL